MSWKCDICGVLLSSSSQNKHLKSPGHLKRLTPPNGTDFCKICKVNITISNIARHKASRIHISALSMAEEQQKNIASTHAPIVSSASAAIAEEKKVIDSPLDRFIVEDVARYVGWMQENPRNTATYRNPRSVVYTVINNLYAAIACNDIKCAWWPKYFALPDGYRGWREDILHRSIGDVAMAESILIAARSELTFESK